MRWWLLLTVLGCQKPVSLDTADAPERLAEAEATAGIRTPAFASLLAAHWDDKLRTSPEWATSLGVPGLDDQVSDPSTAAASRQIRQAAAFLGMSRSLDGIVRDPREVMFLDMFRASQRRVVEESACRFETWTLSARGNVMADLFGVLDIQPLRDADGLDAMLRRLQAWNASVPRHEDALREGLAEGLVANATSVGLVIDMVRRQLDTPTAEWPVATRELPGEAWAAGAKERIVEALDATVRPALEGYATLLQDEVMPAARGDEAPGLASLPNGADCYAALVRRYTTLDLTPAELHQTGLDALAGIHDEFRAIAPTAIGEDALPRIFAHLRTADELHFDDEDGIVATAEAALERARQTMPAWFGRLPQAECVVAVVPAYEAPYTTIAYYRQPAPDGSKPGEYFVNTHEPTTRPRHEAEVLAFHESIPGHHLQIAISYELDAVPAFHRYAGQTAFVEGWALYTERLADEMGLYTSDVDRLGMLSFDAWRAARLVVDTGLHDLGWSRQQAEAFLLENTPLAENNIVNEVDRYITWPGQALAYKTGQLEIRRLRAEAEAALGERFELSTFHDLVLGAGAVSLPVLRSRVTSWIARHP